MKQEQELKSWWKQNSKWNEGLCWRRMSYHFCSHTNKLQNEMQVEKAIKTLQMLLPFQMKQDTTLQFE